MSDTGPGGEDENGRHRLGAISRQEPGGTSEDICRPEAPDDGDWWVRENLTASAAAVRTLRQRMQAWVHAVGLDEDTAHAIVLVAHEAVLNAFEHAYAEGVGLDRHGPGDADGGPDGGEGIELVAGPCACGRGVGVLVADRGTWRPRRDPPHQGRGTALIRELSDRSSIDTGDRGTTVRLCWSTTALPTAILPGHLDLGEPDFLGPAAFTARRSRPVPDAAVGPGARVGDARAHTCRDLAGAAAGGHPDAVGPLVVLEIDRHDAVCHEEVPSAPSGRGAHRGADHLPAATLRE